MAGCDSISAPVKLISILPEFLKVLKNQPRRVLIYPELFSGDFQDFLI